MRIDDLILALQRGGNSNDAIMAAAQAPAPGGGTMPPVQPTGDDAAPLPTAAPVPAPAVPTPQPRPPAAPAAPPTPVTNPLPAEGTPRMMKSPPDLSNMYLQLIRDNQNAARLDSGLSTIAAGFSKYPENRAALLSGSFNKSGQQNITSEDIVKLQGLHLKNQALQIRQAAKVGLMKQYGLSRDTVDYLDASDKLDEVIKAKNTGTLVQVENKETGDVHMVDNATGRTISTIKGGLAPTEDKKALDAVNAGRVAAGQPPVSMEDYIKTIKRDEKAAPNATDEAALASVNEGRVARGLPPIDMETYITSVKRDPRQAANEADTLNLAAINKERPADKQMTMEYYLKNIKRTGTTVNVGPQGEKIGDPEKGFVWKRNEDGTVWINPDTKLPEQVAVAGSKGPSELRSSVAGATTDELKVKETEEKKRKAETMKIFTESNIGKAVDTALNNVGNWGVVGLGSEVSRNRLMPKGRTTDIYDSAISTITANTVVETLQRMREGSPTGGALGNVTDFENKMLRDITASLATAVDKETATANLIRIKAATIVMNHQRYDDKSEPREKVKARFDADLAAMVRDLTEEHMNKEAAGGKTKFKNIRRID
jgi:hypothetical protein